MIGSTLKKTLPPDSTILVTGVAGFIGSAVAEKLLENKISVVGIDNLNKYYDINLKLNRLKRLANSGSNKNFDFIKMNLCDGNAIRDLFKNHSFDYVVHMAAQAGVRYSLENPQEYIDSNIQGFFNLLEASQSAAKLKHMVYASSSSVYGGSKNIPFSESEKVNRPVSLYAATKASNELMAFAYSHLHGIPITGVRLFTVYGPWGRPDMAAFGFLRKILASEEIEIFNNGDMKRDFTYINDVVEAILRILTEIPSKILTNEQNYENAESNSRVLNIGNGSPVSLMEFVSILEKCIGKKAKIKFVKFQPGDVKSTFADMTEFKRLTEFEFRTPLEVGLTKFVSWYTSYFK